MGYAITLRRAYAVEAEARHKRRSELWAQAQAERARWRAEMLPPVIAAEMLGIHRNTLLRWAKAGRIPAYKLGDEAQSPVRFWKADVDRLKATLSGQPVPDVDPAGLPRVPEGMG